MARRRVYTPDELNELRGRRWLTAEDLIALGVVGSKATLLRWEKSKGFPKRVYLGDERPRWSAAEIWAWEDACASGDREPRVPPSLKAAA